MYDIDDVLGQTLERAVSLLGGRPLETDLQPLLVRVDPAFLGATVTNIIENAVKYTTPDARIRVTAVADGDEVVRLTVEDDGPGVGDAALPRLFDRFYRVEGVAGTARGGLGIGLAVARGLTEAMGGRIGARRSDLGGLAIDLDLPAATVTT